MKLGTRSTSSIVEVLEEPGKRLTSTSAVEEEEHGEDEKMLILTKKLNTTLAAMLNARTQVRLTTALLETGPSSMFHQVLTV